MISKITKRHLISLSFIICYLSVGSVFTACSDDDDTTLTPVTNLSYEPTMGGAIITYTAPANNDLLYVKASYTNSQGNRVFRSSSIYDNKIEIEGLADETKTYPVDVTAVDKWGGETSAVTINVQPGRSYINIIKDNLQIHPMCGGLSLVCLGSALRFPRFSRATAPVLTASPARATSPASRRMPRPSCAASSPASTR